MFLHSAVCLFIILFAKFSWLSSGRNFSTNSTMAVQRGIKKLVTAHQQREGGGFIVRRPIGGEISHCDPFLLLDHLGPVDNKPGEAVGALDHPHRGFETVSYIISGSSQHKDSAGNSGTLKDGWVQWMTAGSGVVHSEMPSDEMIKNGGRSEGFQLWVNLPAKDKMIPPRYQDTPADKIPIVTKDNGKVWVKVIAGESLGTKAVIETRTPILFLDIRLQPGVSFTQPVSADFNGFAYVWKGSGFLGSDRVKSELGQVGVLGDGSEFTLEASPNDVLHVLLIAGIPIKEPISRYGPFVMNTQEEIQQAFADYRAGRLGAIEGSEDRYAATEAARQKQKETGRWKNDL